MAEENKELEKPTSRQRLTDRYRKSRPDLNWNDENIDNDIEGLAADELSKYDEDRASRKAFDEKMSGLLSSDEVAAGVFTDWSNGGDPVKKLISSLGPDIAEALTSGAEDIDEVISKWRDSKKAEAEHDKEMEANAEKSAKIIIDFADKNGLDDEQLKSIIDRARDLAVSVLSNLFTEEILETVMKAGNYDSAVSDAMETGRINGKNENIRKELRTSKSPTGLPPTVGEQNFTSGEGTQEKPRKGKLSMFGDIEVKKK